MSEKHGSSPESIVREIKRQTRRKFTAEEKIRIVLEPADTAADIRADSAQMWIPASKGLRESGLK